MPFIYQLLELALAGHRVIQIKAGKLILARARRHGGVLDDPVIKRPVILELQGTEAVRDPLEGIGQRMGEVVHGINHPLVTGLMMHFLADAIENRIAQIQVGALHVDFGTQYSSPLVQLTAAHLLEQGQILFHAALAIGAWLARRGEITAVLGDLLRAQAVHVGQPLVDQLHGQLIKPVEIVAGKLLLTIPGEPKPLHILLDRLDVLILFLLGIGIIEAQIATAVIAFGNPEVQADRLGMTNMQVPIGFRWKTGHHLAVVFTFCKVTVDDLSDKIAGRFRFAHGSWPVRKAESLNMGRLSR